MLDKKQFGSDFKWGVSTAAYQIEGAKVGLSQAGGGWANLRGVAVVSSEKG
jgi:beta-glucosidase/6-phospho-beta-glucosidase/beta-galactosidase